MLQLLHIENIAVIERADISFRAGFNALTGETGAGKSIVIDSLGAVLGARTSRDLIRTGAAKAFVSAEFDGVDASLPVLAALGVEPEDGVLLLQRDIYADGKNICRANGRPITRAAARVGDEPFEYPRPARGHAAARRGAARRVPRPLRPARRPAGSLYRALSGGA